MGQGQRGERRAALQGSLPHPPLGSQGRRLGKVKASPALEWQYIQVRESGLVAVLLWAGRREHVFWSARAAPRYGLSMRTTLSLFLVGLLLAAAACQTTEPDVAAEATDARMPNVRYYMIADT